MSRAPRFLISGYYGFANTGDEAMLAGLLEGFRELRPDAELTVLSGNPAETMAEHGVIAVDRGLRGVRQHVRLCDAFISGGGGLLQDVTSWRSPLYYLAAIHLARRARRPIACIGQSIGPLKRGWVRSLVRRELSRADAIAVRDELSRDLLSQLSVIRNVEVTADLAFLLPRPSDSEMAAAREKAGIAAVSDPLAAVALRSRPGVGGDEETARAAVAIGRTCDEVGLRPLLVPMQPSQDVSVAREAAAAIPSRNALVAPPLRAREMLALIGSCQMVIAIRLHALVFAALCGLPPVAISYDPKVDGLMARLGLAPATDLARFEGESLAQVVRETWERRSSISETVAARLPGLRAAALRNVELALSVLPHS